MNRIIIALLVLSLSLVVAGCGSDNPPPPTVRTQILSDAAFDGYISLDATGLLTVTQGNTEVVKVGIEPGANREFRTFLDFPLGGPGGVPLDAIISSATLDIFINTIQPSPFVGTIPIRIDLVDFQPPTLLGSDFDRTQLQALASMPVAVSLSQDNVGFPVSIDVTPLMVEAQRLGLPDLQLRILRELGPAPPGLVEINDTTGPLAGERAPLLEVIYF